MPWIGVDRRAEELLGGLEIILGVSLFLGQRHQSLRRARIQGYRLGGILNNAQ